MTETAPERIWAAAEAGSDDFDAGTFCTVDDGGVPYVRADLLDDAVKALEEIDKKFEYHNFLESSPVRHLARATLAKLRSHP
ncbi:hypothetical protein [Sulfitobacter sp. 1A12157]|uniref:hypothetical protein n=1 Tax=Sulfitobacter sp. 1A12157 TaxID=3368594 RepID=UPI0037470CC4